MAAEEKGRARAVAAAAAAVAMRLEGVDEGLARMAATANLDQAPERRQLRDAFRDVQLGIDHCLFKVMLPSLPLLSPFLSVLPILGPSKSSAWKEKWSSRFDFELVICDKLRLRINFSIFKVMPFVFWSS